MAADRVIQTLCLAIGLAIAIYLGATLYHRVQAVQAVRVAECRQLFGYSQEQCAWIVRNGRW
jgi:ABC-type nickel/cobalt efflux system permease component RcnA